MGQASPTVAQKVRLILLENLLVTSDEINPTSDLREDLGADSLDLTNIAIALEAEFFPTEQISRDQIAAWKTCADVLQTVTNRLNPFNGDWEASNQDRYFSKKRVNCDHF
jgi:acyl carrier protein